MLPHTPAVRPCRGQRAASRSLVSRSATKVMVRRSPADGSAEADALLAPKGRDSDAGPAAAAIEGRTTFTETVYNRSGRRPDSGTYADQESVDQEHVADAALLLEGAEDVRDEHRRCAPGLPRRA